MTIGRADHMFVAFEIPKGQGKKPAILQTEGQYKWTVPVAVPNQIEALLLVKNRVIAAGTTDREQRHKAPAFLWVFDVRDGKIVNKIKLDTPPIYDGFAAADGRFYLSTTDGKLTCYGAK